MAIKLYRPTTPSRRNMTSLQIEGLSKNGPEKSLLLKKKKHAGRNSYGRTGAALSAKPPGTKHRKVNMKWVPPR